MQGGLFLGALNVVVAVIANLMFGDDSLLFVYAMTIGMAAISAAVIVQTTMGYKSLCKEKFTYIRSLQTMIITSFFGSIILILASFLFLKYNPGFVADFFDKLIEAIKSIPEMEDMQSMYEEYKKIYMGMSTMQISIQFGWTFIIFAMIFSLIASIFTTLRKEKK